MKKIQVRPAEEILLRISEKEEYKLTFNTKCAMYVQQSIKEITGSNKLTKENYSDILPAILYGAINAQTEQITLERASEIASIMGVNEGIAIINEFTESMTSSMTPEQKKRMEMRAGLLKK